LRTSAGTEIWPCAVTFDCAMVIVLHYPGNEFMSIQPPNAPHGFLEGFPSCATYWYAFMLSTCEPKKRLWVLIEEAEGTSGYRNLGETYTIPKIDFL